MQIDRELAAIREKGYVVFPELLSSSQLAALRQALEPHLRREYFGRNDFEGHLTERVYTLVDRGPVFEDLAAHPLVLALCDALLEPNYLLTASQAINIHPGETAQAVHTDDGFYRIARPREAVSVSTIWAIDAFTKENGGTQVIAGSHLWDDTAVGDLLYQVDFTTEPRGTQPSEATTRPSFEQNLRTVVMPAGSLIFFLGTLVHRGGANRSDRPRLALSNQYCAPWARQQENYTLAIPPERVARMAPRVQELIGYSIHPPFMGHTGGLHPRRRLAH